MPTANSLPEPIRAITNLNAVNVRIGRDFKGDMDALVEILQSFGRPTSPARLDAPTGTDHGPTG